MERCLFFFLGRRLSSKNRLKNVSYFLKKSPYPIFNFRKSKRLHRRLDHNIVFSKVKIIGNEKIQLNARNLQIIVGRCQLTDLVA